MKIIKYILILMMLSMILSAQTKQADVFPAGGGQSENSQYKNFGTFGQPAASSSSNSSYKNNEGFLNGQSANVPIVTTGTVSSIHDDVATAGGEIIFHGGAPITSSGLIYSLSQNAEIGDVGVAVVYTNPLVDDGTFELEMTGLTYGETYYVRAFAENEMGYGYGDDVSFVSIPTLGEWGMIAFATLIAGFGGWFMWRRVV